VPGIHAGGGLLDDGEGVDEADRHAFLRAEREIFDAALGLCAPIGGGGDLNGADGVGFGAGFGHFGHS
jgi:hypothetical protein